MPRAVTGRAPPPCFGTAAGISFGVQAAATKLFVAELGNGVAALLMLAATYVLILTALGGFVFQQSALKTGFLAPAMAATNAATLATSVLLGVVIFNESLASSGHLPFALVSLGVSVFGVVVLAAQPGRISPPLPSPSARS